MGNARDFQIAGGQPLFQYGRGSYEPSTHQLNLGPTADASTFLHESGHHFLDVVTQLAGQDDAPASVRADADTLIVVNSARSAAEFAHILPSRRVVPIDALTISREQGLGRIVNSALLGALARVIQAPTLAVLTQALVDNAPKHHDENIAACTEGYRWADRQLSGVAA